MEAERGPRNIGKLILAGSGLAAAVLVVGTAVAALAVKVGRLNKAANQLKSTTAKADTPSPPESDEAVAQRVLDTIAPLRERFIKELGGDLVEGFYESGQAGEDERGLPIQDVYIACALGETNARVIAYDVAGIVAREQLKTWLKGAGFEFNGFDNRAVDSEAGYSGLSSFACVRSQARNVRRPSQQHRTQATGGR